MNSDIKKINEEINEKLKEIRKRKNMIKGSINMVYTKCGNPNCKCARGFKHQEYRLTYKDGNNITKTVYLSKRKINKIKKRIDNYKMAKKLFNDIIGLNLKLIKIEK